MSARLLLTAKTIDRTMLRINHDNDMKDMRPTPKAGVLDMSPLCPGKEHAPGVAKVHKLSSNETPIGASKHAIEAYRAAAERLEIYPDGQATALKKAIADVHGLNADNILCGNGSDELLGLLCQTYLSPRRRGHLHRTRLHGVQDLHHGCRGDPSRRQGK